MNLYRSRTLSGFAFLVAILFAASAFAQEKDEKKDDTKKKNENVIKPENANPNEKYNLPPNFDPNFKPKKTPKSQKVTLDFRQAQLDEVVKMFSSVMEKNFIISDSINTSKTITIISPKPVPLNEAYRAFLAALQMNGLTVVPFGKFLKIVESSKAIQEPLSPYGETERLPNEARMVTAIVPIENAGVDEIQGVIQKFVTPEATIIPYGSSLIITENGANLRRIQKLIKKLDQGDSANKVYVYKVLYSDATEVAAKLEEIFKKAKSGSSSSKAKAKDSSAEQLDVDVSDIIPDERTNQLIIISNRRSFEKIKKMIEILDVPTVAGGQIHVKFLEYSDAEELSQTLSQLAQGNNNRNNNRNARGNQARNVRNANANANVGDVAELLSGEVQITAHPPSNALVVIASPRDFLSLENVINLLDRPRKQVYVEAVIMEIGMDTDRQIELGFGAGTAADLDGVIPDSLVEDGLISDTNGLLVGQSNNPGLGAIDSTLGLIGPILTIPGTSISLPAFVLALNATQRDVATNILSTPSIMTLNNEEAEIQVGQRIRFRTNALGTGNLSSLVTQGAQDAGLGNLSSLGGLGLLGGAVETADIGITLRITPQVNESQYVRLEVDQEVTDILGAIEPGEAPNETRRNIKTIVMVKDQATVAIGGLIRDVDNETTNKVPFLGDIPVLGVLFRSTGTIKTKQNLVLMLTPYIIESDADLKKIRERKLQEREELLKLFGRRDISYMKTVNFDRKSGLLDRMKRQIYDARNAQKAREDALKAFDQNGPQYRILGDDEEREIEREKLEDGGIRFDPEAE